MGRISVGEKFPDFTFNTATEKNKTISGLLHSGKTVLWVIRYIGCTVCRYDIHLLTERYDKIAAKNAKVAVVLQSDPAIVREELKDCPAPFDIICDTDMNIYKTLEILPAESMDALVDAANPAVMDALKKKGDAARARGFSHGKYEGNEQQLPALFILDQDGRVIHAHYGKNIMDMPTVDALIEML